MQGIRSLSLAFVLTLSLSPAALAQAPPAISSIDPRSGPASGGIKVTLSGSNFDLPPDFRCILPCPTRVFFGPSEGVIRDLSNTRVVVVAPPHEPGPVDVTLTTGDGRTTTVPMAFTYETGGETAYQVLLLPIYLDSETPGANGSIWKTELWMRNNGTQTLFLAPWICPEGMVCPAIFPLTYALTAGESVRNLPAVERPAGAPPARLLYVSRGATASFSINLRVADISRAVLNGGTDMPVVREDEFLTSTTNLLNVPLDSNFRQTLRIYEMRDATGDTLPSSFRVRIYSQQVGTTSTLLIEKTVVATSAQSGLFRDQPAFGQIPNLAEGLPNIGSGPTALRIEIEPLTTGSRYWAMISVTNNETQQITTVTPQ